MIRACLYFIATLLSLSSSAKDFFDAITVDSPEQLNEQESSWSHRGYLQQSVKYGVESPPATSGLQRSRSGISQVKTHFFSEIEGDINDDFSAQLSFKQEIESHYWQDNESSWKIHNNHLSLKDAYLDWVSKNNLWLRLGHQVIAWGEAEGLNVLDVMSPVDQREPGQTQLQDIREQVPALFLDYSINQNINVSLVSSYRAQANRFADANDPFDFFAAYRSAGFKVQKKDEEQPWEFGLRAQKRFNGGEISFILADINSRQYSLSQIDPNSLSAQLDRKRQKVAGLKINKAIGNFLWRGEFAWYSSVAIATTNLSPWPEKKQLRAATNLEYSGWSNWLVSLELNASHTSGYKNSDEESFLVNDQTSTGQVLRAEHTMFNERIRNQWWLLKLGAEKTRVARWDFKYELNDSWDIGLGYVSYQVNDPNSFFYPFRNNDSINAVTTYSF